MDSTILNYRKKHPRCRYCKYYKVEINQTVLCDYVMCEAKDKVLSDMKAYCGGMFCSCFVPRDD